MKIANNMRNLHTLLNAQKWKPYCSRCYVDLLFGLLVCHARELWLNGWTDLIHLWCNANLLVWEYVVISGHSIAPEWVSYRGPKVLCSLTTLDPRNMLLEFRHDPMQIDVMLVCLLTANARGLWPNGSMDLIHFGEHCVKLAPNRPKISASTASKFCV